MNPADLAGLDEQLAAVKVRTISPPESDLDTPHAAEGDTAPYATEGDTAAFAANDTGDSASGIIKQEPRVMPEPLALHPQPEGSKKVTRA